MINDKFLRNLDDLQGIKQTGNNKWTALCPAHDDHNPSLSIALGDDGRILLKCHAGCSIDNICANIGICKEDLKPEHKATQSPKISQTYDYCDKNNELLYQVCRYEPKGFRQRRPDGNDGWTWNLQGVTRVLYRQYELLSSDKDALIFICEGEKDVDTLTGLGLIATTSPMGAGAWKDEYSEVLVDRRVAIIPDNDDPGKEHARKVATSLHGVASELKVIQLPDLAEHDDVSDWLGNGGTSEKLKSLADQAEEFDPKRDAKDISKKNVASEDKRSHSTILIELGQQGELFHDANNNAYVTVPVKEHNETWPIKTRGFKCWLSGQFWSSRRKAPSAQAMQDALGVLSSIAVFDNPEKETSIRVAKHDDAIWIDLVNSGWEAVKITPAGWELVSDPPVKFLRSKAMQALPRPIQGGSISVLRQFLNIGSDEDWTLILSWIIATLRPVGPYPVLLVNGEQGSCKSTLCRILRAICDPNEAPIRAEPRNARDLMIAATNSRVLAFDNLSYIPPWLSDAFCRLSTGGGFATRELYSDGEETIFNAMRPMMINGISELASRSDLLDRAISVTLPTIKGARRKTEAGLWEEFDKKLPLILGALFDAISSAMRKLPTVELKELPRLADFATWAVAASEGLGLSDDAFMSAYSTNKDDGNSFAIEASPIGPAILEMMKQTLYWQGTAQELLTELEENHCTEQTKRRREWPKNPRAIGKAVRRLAPNLRQIGIDARFERSSGKDGTRMIILECTGEKTSETSETSEETLF